MKIVICGGHFTPAQALIEELESSPRHSDLQIIFFGRKHATEGSKNTSSEYNYVQNKKIKFFNITTGRLQRKFTQYTIPSLLKIPVGFLQSILYLISTRPHIIVSFGGYLSTPIVIAGWLLGIPSVTHEQSTVPGLATKINSLFVKKVFVSWPQTAEYFEGEKGEVIGNSFRKSVATGDAKTQAINNFLKRAKNLIYIMGGSQGSHFINTFIFENVNLFKNYSVIHQIGTTNYKGDHEKAKKIKATNYLAQEYVNAQDLAAIYKKASIIISRSGANTVWELAALAKPAILIPLPHAAGNEQLKNAEVLQKAGSAIVLKQESVTPNKFIATLKDMVKNLIKYNKCAKNLQTKIPTDGTKKLARFIESRAID